MQVEFLGVADRAVYLEGGAGGYTEELDLHLWLLKVRALAGAWGGQAEHRARVMAAISAPVDQLTAVGQSTARGRAVAADRGTTTGEPAAADQAAAPGEAAAAGEPAWS